jgi:membrane fusion protein, multidrug efflux system
MTRIAWLTLMVVAMAAAAARAQETSPGQSVLVTTAPLHQGTVQQTITAYGTTQAAPDETLDISFLHPGQVVQLRVIAGQVVHPGDALLDFAADPTTERAYNQAVADLAFARQQRGLTQTMLDQHLATKAQLDQADKAVRDAEAALQEQERLGSGRTVETVKAQFAGAVTNIAVTNGARVAANTTVMQISRSDGLLAILGISPEDRPRIRSGQHVRISAIDQPGHMADSQIASLGGVADAKTGLVNAVAPIPADGGSVMIPGEHVSAEIDAGALSGWIVPRAAVLIDDRGAYVFQVTEGKAIRVSVSIRGEVDDRLAIDGPLDPARPLVVTGNYQLADGMAVREETSSQNAQAAPAATGAIGRP